MKTILEKIAKNEENSKLIRERTQIIKDYIDNKINESEYELKIHEVELKLINHAKK